MSEKRKRLVVIVPGVPHPARGASVVLFYHYLQAIRDAGYETLNILLRELNNLDDTAVDRYRQHIGSSAGFEVRAWTIEPVFPLLGFRIGHRTGQFDEIRSAIADFRPDTVVCFDLSSASAVLGMPISRKVVWLGDLNFDSHWYHYLYSFREQPATLRWLPYALVQRRIWRRLYKGILSEFDEVIVSSESSEHRLRDIGCRAAYLPYPWPNQGPIIDRDTERRRPDKPTFLVFGNLVGLGSRSMLHFLIREIYPRLARVWGSEGFQIYLAGREQPGTWFLEKLRAMPEIRYLGFVDDLAALMAKCHAVLVPISVPVGNRSRILTAMAKRALIIAHRSTSLANPSLVDGVTCLLAKDADEFVQRMLFAVKNVGQCQRMIDKAEEAYKQFFSPEIAAKRIINVIEGHPAPVLAVTSLGSTYEAVGAEVREVRP